MRRIYGDEEFHLDIGKISGLENPNRIPSKFGGTKPNRNMPKCQNGYKTSISEEPLPNSIWIF